MVATVTYMVRVGDTVHQVWAGVTTADSEASVVRDHPEVWAELVVDFPAEPEAPSRPSIRAGRPAWDAYAVSLGLDPDAVSALSKADLVTVVDAVESGTARVGDDGSVTYVEALEAETTEAGE